MAGTLFWLQSPAEIYMCLDAGGSFNYESETCDFGIPFELLAVSTPIDCNKPDTLTDDLRLLCEATKSLRPP